LHLRHKRLHRLQHPHSFPTRRSSDLLFVLRELLLAMQATIADKAGRTECERPLGAPAAGDGIHALERELGRPMWEHLLDHLATRSEEHTSELQSRFDLVCRLVLENKKITEPPRRYERAKASTFTGNSHRASVGSVAASLRKMSSSVVSFSASTHPLFAVHTR